MYVKFPNHNIKLAYMCSPWTYISEYGFLDVKQLRTEHIWSVTYLNHIRIKPKVLFGDTGH